MCPYAFNELPPFCSFHSSTDYCGRTNFDLEINKEVSIQNPDVTSYICVWQFKAPPSSRMLLQFSTYDLVYSSVFVVSLSNVTVDDALNSYGMSIPDYIVFYPEGNMGGPSVPRDRAVRNESIWVMLAHANREDRQSSSSSVFSLHVTALNESGKNRRLSKTWW